jgi:homoserine kinase
MKAGRDPQGLPECRAFAPASVGNVAVGFDLLGHSLDALGDRVTARRRPMQGVRIARVRGVAGELPHTADENTAGKAALALLERAGAAFGVELEIEKGIPLGSGLGGSAASAVAAVVAVNPLLAEPLDEEALLDAAVAGEAVASGSAHADNVAASLLGGLVLVLPATPRRALRIPVPPVVRAVVVHPQLSVSTREARALLRPTVDLAGHVRQSANLAGFLEACRSGDLGLLRAVFEDVLVEPQRAHLVPGFADVQRAAREAGALGCSLSGAGPSLFAWVREPDAAAVGEAMAAAFRAHGLASERWIVPIDPRGAYRF